MAPKNKFTKEEMVEAALRVVREKGMEGLSAKSMASALGTSTQPVFTAFGSMAGIKQAVYDAAVRVYDSYTEKGLQEQIPFFGVGIQYIRFAREEPQLFKALCVSEEFTGRPFSAIDATLPKVMSVVERTGEVYGEKAKRLHACMTIFCHGAGVMEASDALMVPKDAIDLLMSDVFRALKEYYKILPDETETGEEEK